MPTARQPAIFASCPTTLPTAPLAAETTTVSPAFGVADLGKAHPGRDARACPAAPSHTVSGSRGSGSFMSALAVGTRAKRCQPSMPTTLSPAAKPGWREAVTVAHRAAHHHLAQLHPRGVGLALVHAPAHVGVEREPVHADQHLALAGLRHGRLHEAEIRLLHPAGGAGRQHDLQVLFAHDSSGRPRWRAIIAGLRHRATIASPFLTACCVPWLPSSSSISKPSPTLPACAAFGTRRRVADAAVVELASQRRRQATGSDFLPCHLHRVVAISCALRERDSGARLVAGRRRRRRTRTGEALLRRHRQVHAAARLVERQRLRPARAALSRALPRHRRAALLGHGRRRPRLQVEQLHLAASTRGTST